MTGLVPLKRSLTPGEAHSPCAAGIADHLSPRDSIGTKRQIFEGLHPGILPGLVSHGLSGRYEHRSFPPVFGPTGRRSTAQGESLGDVNHGQPGCFGLKGRRIPARGESPGNHADCRASQ